MVNDNNIQSAGILYLVPTPIGNLEDMTYRAVRILSEVDIVAAEDTRHTGTLLKHFDIHKPLVSYHEHNKEEKGIQLIAELEAGKQVAVVSDAGMPAISDPGADLVVKAIAAGITIVPLPGANAALTTLIASGLDTTEFTFAGFLPKRAKNRQDALLRYANYEGTLIFYEAPHRLKEVLPDMAQILGDRAIVVGREITKKFETFTRSTLQELLEHPELLTVKGEFVLIVEGKTEQHSEMADMAGPDAVSVVEEVQQLIITGLAKKEAIREVAKRRGLARRDVYNEVEACTEDFHDNE